MAFEGISPEEKEELLEGVLNNAYHGIVALDAVRDATGKVEDFVYIYANQNAETILDKSQSDLIGHGILEVFPGIKDEGILKKYLEVLETGASFNFDHFYDRDGLSANFQVSMNKFRDGVIVSFVETTEQVNQSQQLKVLSERLDMATSAAKVGVWEYDLKTKKLIWDEAMHRIYDLPREQFADVFEAWEKRVHPEDLPALNAEIQDPKNYGSDMYAKFRIVLDDGSIRWIDARARMRCNDAGEPVAMVGTNWDITELVYAYDTLAKAKEQADRANAAKSEFLAVMSHELRTPLNPIIGCTELLRDQIGSDADRSLLEMIEHCGRELLGLISDILDFCTLDEGQLTLNPVSVDILELTQAVCREFKRKAEAKGLALTISPSRDIPAKVCLDPKRYQQIIRNLLSNAVKFTDAGHIRIDLATQKDKSGKRVLLAKCRDTGCGIPGEQLEFIFERFTQLDASNTRKEGGTGLGLAICRRLCDLMGGNITIGSEPGKGTTATMELPIDAAGRAAEPESGQKHLGGFAGHEPRALIIDDDMPNLLYLKAAMSKSGVRVETANDPSEGLSRALSESYEIIFLDVHMPSLSGMDIVRKLRGAPGPNQNVPVVAVTADVRPEQKEECLSSGFSLVLNKPVKPQQLKTAINDLVRF